MATQIMSMASILQNLQIPAGVNPAIVHLPAPPRLEGGLGTNNWLTKTQKHAPSRVNGPKSMLVVKDGNIFTGTADGYLVHVKPDGSVKPLRNFSTPLCGKANAPEGACGRPMGIRLDNFGLLVIADAYQGIFRLNQYTGERVLIVDAKKLQLGFINDLVVSKEGTIYFTSSSSKWPLSKQNNIVFEAENTGRVLSYKDGIVTELVSNLSFPSGLELAPNGSYLLIAEGTFSRIWRAWIGENAGAKKGVLEVWANNLPGVVDNIRLSPRETFWVAFSQSRHSMLPSVLDTKGTDRKARAALIVMVNKGIQFEPPRFGIVCELDKDANILRSLQDPTGGTFASISEVQENDRFIFFASPMKNHIGFLSVAEQNSQPELSTQPATDQANQTFTTNSTNTNSVRPLESNPVFLEFVFKLRQKLENMTTQVIKQVVVELVRELILSKQQTLVLRRMVESRDRVIQQLQQTLLQLHKQLQQQQQKPTATGSNTTTVGGTTATTTTAVSSNPPTTTTKAPTITAPPPTTQPPPLPLNTTPTAATTTPTTTPPTTTTITSPTTTSPTTPTPTTTSPPSPPTTTAATVVTTAAPPPTTAATTTTAVEPTPATPPE